MQFQSTNMDSRRVIIRRLPPVLQLRDFNCDYNIARHLSDDELSKYIIKRDVAGLIKVIYKHPKVPSHACVRYESGHFIVYTNNRWERGHNVVRELIETAYRVMHSHYIQKPDHLYDAHAQFNIEPNMYKIGVWLEDLWDNALDEMADIKSDIIRVLQ